MTDSKSDKHLKNKQGIPTVTPNMVRSVSQFRREKLEEEVEYGKFREPGTQNNYAGLSERTAPSPAGFVKSSSGLNKYSQFSILNPNSGGAPGGAGTGFRGPGGTLRQTPEVYSPLWLNSNLNLPRDRATINAWSRSFFALNPIVHNAITLHSTYPIAKLNIKCKNQKVEKFFSEMSEELELMNVCSQIAQEFWVLGEAFVYGELDDRTAKWSRLLLQ